MDKAQHLSESAQCREEHRGQNKGSAGTVEVTNPAAALPRPTTGETDPGGVSRQIYGGGLGAATCGRERTEAGW